MEAATVPTRALVTATSLNVRAGPGTTYAIDGKLPEGTEVTLLERKGNWFRVSGPSNLTGWVDGTYLTARLDGIRIVVDPGHGGSDGGAYWNGVRERDVNLKIAQYLRDVLEARGAQVRMTRETWKENPPRCGSGSRTEMANKWPADMLLSVHNNSSTNTNARGMLTMWGNAPQSEALARAVLERTLYWTNTRQGFDHVQFGKGVYRDTAISGHTVYATNCSKVPATLIEVAFVSNKDDAALLKQETFLKAVAKGIADGAGAFILNRVPEGSSGGDEGTPGGGTPGDNPPSGSPVGQEPGSNPAGGGSPGSGQPDDGDQGSTPGTPEKKVELFPDVAGTLADEVHRARQLGLVDGYGDGRFHPNDPVTRAAFAKMVVLAVEKATGQSLPRPDQSPFKDVNQRQALYEYVLKAAAAKYIRGYGDGTFRPNLAIPREQVAAILQRAAKLEGRPEPFVDVSGSSPFAPAIGAVVEAGLMKGEGGGIFGYGKPITRAQAAAVAVRLYEYLKGGN